MSDLIVLGLTKKQKILKISFDLVMAIIGLIICSPFIIGGYLISSYETKSSGFFLQNRIGRNGKLFKVIKLKTMSNKQLTNTTVTHKNDPRITKSGRYLRKFKIDELPQLFNVIKGEMSLVGPRPDVPGFADTLKGSDRLVLTIRPGITGPASIKYKDEEILLSKQEDPELYNRKIIFPDKVKINIQYIKNWSLLSDIVYIFKTF
jgi:lipopolysaccharide/colanic/teichoic acid biosynthesis glycosyltransferase